MQIAQKSKVLAIHESPLLAAWPVYFKDADRQEASGKVVRCVEWLRHNGFEVRGVQIGARNPRVIIRSSPLCDQLDGAVFRFERIGLVKLHYWVAIRFGCEVRWLETGEEA